MISREALFDELVKIGEARQEAKTKTKGLRHALKTIGVAGAGAGVGYGAAELIARNMKFFKEPTAERAQMAKVIIPIATGVTALLAGKRFNKIQDELSKVKGYRDPRKGSKT